MVERENYKLTDRLIKSLCGELPLKTQRYGDGENLYLFHESNGSIYWVFEYRFQTDKDIKPKQKQYRIGIYKSAKEPLNNTFKPKIGIKEARLERDRLKLLLKQGIDPAEQKKQSKVTATQSDIFRNIVADFLEHKKATTTPTNSETILAWQAVTDILDNPFITPSELNKALLKMGYKIVKS